MTLVRLDKDFGIRLLLVLATAYAGTVLGAVCYGSFQSLNFALFHPYGVVATIAMSMRTPKAQIVLAVDVGLSFAFVIVRRLPYWSAVVLLCGYAVLTYVLLLMWRS